MKSAISERCFNIWMVIAFLLLIPCFQASSGAGNIHTKEKFAWSENTGWINMSPINTDYPVKVHGSSYLTGYAWSENIGWIKLSASNEGPSNSSSYSNDESSSDWGVNMASNGSLSGFAWSETAGWINFNNAFEPVYINPTTGIFDGYAWGENIGYIHFKGMAEIGDSYTVTTPRITIDDCEYEEDSGSVIFTVSMSTSIPENVIITYKTEPGKGDGTSYTAYNGIDFSGNEGSVRIYANTTSQTISIPLINDYQQESAEYFRLIIMNATNASIEDSTGIAKIFDDDGHTIHFIVGENGAISTKAGTSVIGYTTSSIDGYAEKSLSVDHKSNLEVTIIPDPGYKVMSIEQNGDKVDYDETNNQYNVLNIFEDYELKFNFYDTTYKITLDQDITNGTCEISGATSNIPYNAERSVTCTGNTNYHLTNLTVCGNTVSQAIDQVSYEHTFNVTNDCSIQAEFAIDSYSIYAIIASGEGNITAIENVSSAIVDSEDRLKMTVEHNKQPKIQISPNGYHHIKAVQFYGTNGLELNQDSVIDDYYFDGTSYEYTFKPVQSSYTLTASFEGNSYTLGMIAGNGGYISYTDNSGQWIQVHNNAFIPVAYKSSRTIKIRPDENSALNIADVNLDGNSLPRQSGTTYTHQFSEIDGHHVIHARFAHILVTQSDQLGEFNQSNKTAVATIQEALTSAIDIKDTISGDPIIAVDPGIYDPVTFVAQALTIFSIQGPETTIIDSNHGNDNNKSCFIFDGINESVKVSGFTLQNGLAKNGGGIYIKNSSPEISDCRIINNEASESGGGIYITTNQDGTIEPRLYKLYIRENTAGEYGGGIFCGGDDGISKPRVYQSIIRKNSAKYKGGGIYVDANTSLAYGHIRLASSWIVENDSFSDGAGIYIEKNAQADIDTTTISNNIVKDGFGGGIFARTGTGDVAVRVSNSILWNNTREIDIDGNPDLVEITYSTIQGGSDDNKNNNGLEPSFVDVSRSDYHIKDQSRLIDKGETVLNLTDSMYLKDIDGYTRKTNMSIDIGGDEWNNMVPDVDFSVSYTGEATPLTAFFTNNTTGDTTLNIWEFGDGTTSNDLNPIHIYQQPGTYTVQLTVFGSSGYSATKSRYDYIEVNDTKSIVNVDFSATRSNSTMDDVDDVGITGYNPLTVNLINLTTPETIIPPNNVTTPWLWDVVNEGTGQSQAPSTDPTDPSPTYQLENPGTYSVKLTVMEQGDDGNEIRKTKTRYHYITVLDSEPNADFEIVPPECIRTESGDCTVTVYDRSTSPKEIIEWNWNCGSYELPTAYDNSPQTCHYTSGVNQQIQLTVKTVESANNTSKELTFSNISDSYTSVNSNKSIKSIIDELPEDKESTIIISSGHYIGNLDLKSKNITLKAKAGDEHEVYIEPSDTTKSTIIISQANTVKLEGLVIQANNGNVRFGGGILVNNKSTLILRNCIVKNNDATIAGGGIAFLNASTGVIENSVIGGDNISDNNSAPYGGGVACLYESSPMIVGSIIKNNDASINGGGIYAYAGSNPVIMNTTIIANDATYGKGGGVYASQAEPYIVHSTIQINTADQGGGIFWKNSNYPVIRHSRIIENSVSNSGGGIYASETIAPQILNVLIAANRSNNEGAGNYLNTVSSANYLFSTIANNTSIGGCPGIYGSNLAPSLIVKNSIFKNNGDKDIVVSSSDTVEISNTAINQEEYTGTTIISESPKFKAYGTSSPDYQLDSGSPCQDAASDNIILQKDLSGNDRKIGNAPDMGVYESNMWPIQSKIESGSGKIMDSNGNIIQSGDYASIENNGTSVFIVEPDVGYTITDVFVDDNSVLSEMTSVGNQKTYTLTNVTEMHTIRAQFDRYSIKVAIRYQGDKNNSTTNEAETSLTMTVVTETDTLEWLLPGISPYFIDVYHGSSLTITAIPSKETQSPVFSGGTPVSGQTYTHLFSNITEPMDITVTAYLKLFTIDILKDSDGTGQGTITPYTSMTTQVKYAESITLEADPASSSKFSGWTGHEVSKDTEITIDNIREHITIIGRFDYKDIQMIVRRVGNEGKVTGFLNGTEITNFDIYVADQPDGYLIPGVIYDYNLELKAQKSNSWKFDRWEWTETSDSKTSNYSATTAYYSWNNLRADTYEITAYFSPDIRSLTIQQQPDTYGSGTLYINQTARSLPITLTYPYNDFVSLEAVADSYSSTFLGWYGSETGSNNYINVLMDDDKTIYVDFSLKKFAIIARSRTGFGEVIPSGTVYKEFGSDHPVTLNPFGDAYLSDIIIDGQSMIDQLGQIETYSFTNITQAHTIDAVFSQYIHVGPGESIQGKISESMDGDTVLVQPGVYYENINFYGKDVTVKSATPFAAIIDGKHLMSTVRFVSEESNRAKLSGFVIRNGNARTGGGIYIDDASPTIENCRIEDNAAELYGGGLYISGDSSPLLINTSIQRNISNGSGGGIYCYQSSPTLTQSIITQNESQLNGGALYIGGNASPNLYNMLIYENFSRYNGGGVAVNSSSAVIRHCTISDNHAGEGVALYAENVQAPNQIIVQNSIFWQTKELVYYVIASDNNSDIQVTGSDIYQTIGIYPGTGNINDDPVFVNPSTNNYQIKSGSECLNKGLDLGADALTIDHKGLPRPFGSSVDMGAFEFNNSENIIHVDFFASSLSGHPGMTVECIGYAFSGARTYTNNEYQWELSTGEQREGINQSFTFNTSGQFGITLTVAGVSKSKVVIVKDTPTASFIVSTTGGYAPLQVKFTDTTQSSHNIKSWAWSFGDGIQNFQQHPTHVYERAGTYTIKFTITDDKENRDTCTKYDYITVLDKIPEVDFFARRINFSDDNSHFTFQFFDTTTSYQAIQSWKWNFGDGTSSTNQNPVKTYIAEGDYTVSLIVKDDNGSYLETKQGFIHVAPANKLTVSQSYRKRSNDNQYSTIQSAIDSAEDGDIIEVAEGTYRENISFNGKNVVVYAKDGPLATSIISKENTNTSVVSFNQNESFGALLQGFTISNGKALYGGGILIANGASPSITNCTINNCSAELSGGGVAVMGNSTNPNISNVTINDNYATNGAGIACLENANIFLDTVSIYQNTSNDSGGGIYVFADATINSKNVTVKDNEAKNYGGGVYLNQTTTMLRDMIIKNNDAAYGCGLAMRANISTLIDRCRITSNKLFTNQSTENKGGGIYVWSSDSPEIRNTFITLNSAIEGGGIYFYNVTTPLVHFSTLADNDAYSGEGKAIHVFSDQPDISPIVNVRNSILWNGGNEIKGDSENMAMITWSDIAIPQLQVSNNWLDYTGNISADPIFSNDNNYQLNQGSPCKNKASSENAPNADYEGDQRPLGTGYDMGADEAVNVPPVAITTHVTVLEDMPTQITLNANDEDGDSMSYQIIEDPQNGEIEGAGYIRTYKPTPNFNGSDSFTFKVIDEYGQNSNIAKVTIFVDPVNDPPEFSIDAKIEVFENSKYTKIQNWATDINSGANGHSSETAQSRSFLVTPITNPEFFVIKPSISKDGDIEFTIKDDITGISQITVELHDNGGTDHNGRNKSDPKIFDLVIKDINDEPTFIVNPAFQSFTVCEDALSFSLQEFVQDISPGSPSEYDQRVEFEVTVDDPELFQQQPTISTSPPLTTATLSLVPAPDMNGSTKLTIYLKDNGCPDTGCIDGSDTSIPHEAILTIVPVNDRPNFTAGEDISVDEDSGPFFKESWIQNPTTGPTNESEQRLVYILSSNHPEYFQSGPTISSTGKLSFTPADDMHGVATVQVYAKDDGGITPCSADCIGLDSSYNKSFLIIIKEINDPPSFVPGDRILYFEEDQSSGRIERDWGTDVSPGKNENQTVRFHTSTEQMEFFDYAPYISVIENDNNEMKGVLGFALKPNVFGEANVSVYLRDSQGATSQETIFTIKIHEMNDKPSFNMSSNLSIFEDSGSQQIANWASNINPGPNAQIYDPPFNENDQSILFNISSITYDNAINASGFFEIEPTINSQGTLSFKTNNNVNGNATITLKLIDDGTSKGISSPQESDEKEFSITVTEVNDPPSFDFIEDHEITINETETPELETYSPFVINIHEGDENGNESYQELEFEVSSNNSELFSIQPTIDRDGSLKFEAKPNAAGLAVVSVLLKDSGGTANNGKDTSAPKTFTIYMTPINDPPIFTLGTHSIVVQEDCGFHEEKGWVTGISPGGGADEAGQILTFKIDVDNNDDFFVQKPIIVFENSIGSLMFEPAPDKNGSKEVELFLMDNLGGTSATHLFTINVLPVNDPPTFKLNYETLSIDEDLGEWSIDLARSIDAGAPDEESQTNLFFQVTVNDPDLFSIQPTMNSEGTLTFQTADNKSGDCTIKVQLNDNQSENNLSEEQAFILSINNVNDAPSFDIGPDQTIKEDSRVQYILNWAKNIHAGAPNESYQQLEFDLEATNKELFLVQPDVRSDGMLYYTPAPDAFGSTQIRVWLKDNGGTAFSGDDTSNPESFSITILAVNDAPTFNLKQEPVHCDEDSGLQQIKNQAYNVKSGPNNEYTQELTFIIETNNDDLFEKIDDNRPNISIDQYGHLRFKPADNAFGSAAITVWLQDNGGEDNDGIHRSSAKFFTIYVDPVNDVPSFVLGAEDINVREDASNQKFANWATQISAGVNEEQSLTFKFDIDNPQLFSILPSISSDGTLTFKSADDANGYVDVKVWLEDDTSYGIKEKSREQEFRINILRVNDKPFFSVGPEMTVYEDSGSHTKPEWAYDISPGANNESGEALTFHTSTDNAALFQRLPEVTPDGDLSFHLAPNQWGTATVVLTLHDTGGTDNGGQDISNAERITIKVKSVNDAPYFTKGPDQLVSEGAQLQEINNWATNINTGPPDESDQTILFSITVDKPQLFAIQPAVSPEGKLTYKPAVNASGIATVTIFAKDNGGTDNGGIDQSEKMSFFITIEGSNDPPSFVKGDDPTVLEDSGEQVFLYWATQISAGGPGEEDQELTFHVNVDDTSLFEIQPVITREGKLTFTPKDDQFGETNVEVFLEDDGPGTNMSVVQNFNITITPVNDPPTFNRGQNLIIFEDRGEQVIPNWVTNISIGPWNEVKEQTPEFNVIPEDPTYFAAGPYISENGELKYTPALNRNGNVNVRIYLTDDGGRLNGGDDTSAPQDFNITILGINDPPDFTLHASIYSVQEDSGQQVVSNWASNIHTGALDEAGQTVIFRLTHEFDYLFDEQPQISSNGVLKFTPKPDASGEAKIIVYLEDNGGTANGGSNVSNPAEFFIDIKGVNDPPTFNKGPDIYVNEDSGAKVVSNWAENISPGAVSELNQTLTFVLDVTNSDLFAYGPEISPVGTLTFTPAPDASGTASINVTLQDDGGVDYGGDFTSDMQNFQIVINPTNDQPTFTKGPDQEVLEGSGNQIVPQWARNISAGSDDEQNQRLEFKLQTNNPELFIQEPKVNTDGTLHYELKDNVAGVASVTIYLEDNGPSTPPNQNISDEYSFKINVLSVNDPPSFDKGPNQYISEDASEQRIENWALNISAGPADESTQVLTFSTITDNDDLFAVLPTITSTGTLIYKTKPDFNGVANVSVQLHDNGGDSNGGTSSSAIQVFMITVYAVNDPPTFKKGPDQIILEDAGEQNIIGWAIDISPGPINESNEFLTFHVTPDNPSLFAIPPEIDITGKLTYTPKNDVFGSTLVSVFLRDNGGVQNGGNNTSNMYQFTIRIESVNDAPSFKPGPGKTVIKSSGLSSFSNWATNIIPGPVNESGQSLSFVVAAINGDQIFTQNPSVSPTGTLSFVVTSGQFGTASVSLYLQDDGGTLNYGRDRSDTITFNISVIDANAPPFFTKGLDQSVPEDCGEINVANWATGIDPGAPDEIAQSVVFHLSTDNDDLFAVLPQVSPEGALTFTPTPNLYGEANVSVFLKDDGGTTNGGNDTSASQDFRIIVESVNDHPEFRMENEYICTEDEPEQYRVNWAYDIKPGPDNEAGQALTFLVTTQHPALFSLAPQIMPSGALIFEGAANASGEAIVSVQLQDDGGIANGGNDTSNDVHFTISITPKNDPPVNTTLPWITGLPQVGEVLTGHQGVWNDNIDTNPGQLTYLYQWQEAFSPSETTPTNIAGERNQLFTIDNSTRPYIRLEITAWDDGEGIPGSLSTVAYSRYIGIGKDPADIDDNGKVDLGDALISIQSLAGIDPNKPMIGGDINGDGQLGLADIIYILVKLSE